ncbi:putative SIR2 family histone deacetylase [Cryphonectria parasitica EP155]|uniref:SIR2 family histone deacetylase n=1 Tax=Cryphonectria parasitica (strain ATCC 38755 / EP155) TaxID=660469 RepID=A0A9P5CHU2_CRYP1|nr:putative SIR2 family histone deacetylase [Cryphonectria parasitica EP155]KAF3760324.1 putative SIR2 family histone deacetylase [Cryphonectria parasitica EP155]
MLASFTQHLGASQRVLALLGAGLSASSGIPTYRGPGGFWTTYSDQQLATPGAFRSDPCLVWQFYEHRREQVLAAQPNAAHFALARLASLKPGFLAVNQNVDGLCQRAGHPSEQIVNYHGSLFRVRCVDESCDYKADDYNVPIVPALQQPPPSSPSQKNTDDARFPLNDNISVQDLPHCPRCKTNLLRPDVVWFGEGVPEENAARVEEWLSQSDSCDLMLVIGTSAMVRPAAGYIQKARQRGARIAFFNLEVKEAGVARPEEADWSFVGDAAEMLPMALAKFLKDNGATI